jgi:hypothetical protein
MKKTILIIGLVLLAASGAFAQVSVAGQTFYYKYLYTVDSDTEVRSTGGNTMWGDRPMPDAIYITFTRNSCYTSDETGISKTYYNISSIVISGANETFIYQGEQNNMFVFMYNVRDSYYSYRGYFNFSKDYKRLNIRVELVEAGYGQHGNLKYVYVYERADPPKPQAETGPTGPDRMW